MTSSLTRPARISLTVATVVVLLASGVVQTAINQQDAFQNPWAWLLIVLGTAGAVYLRNWWLIALVIFVILWPIVVMIPMFLLFFGAP